MELAGTHAPNIARMLRPPEPIVVLNLFPAERARLLELLASLDADDWNLPTVCEGWSVKDLAAHLLADDLGRLSRDRDGYHAAEPERGERLVDFVNRQNEQWVEAARRLSPSVIQSLLRASGDETQVWFASLDPHRLGGPVTWAGPEPAPVWLDLAREFTERWHHHQQIRDAVDAPPLTDPVFFRPVLATFAFAVPHTFRDVDAPLGTAVQLSIEGESGGSWAVVRVAGRWVLYLGEPADAAARVVIDQDAAWRVFTKGLTAEDTESRSRLTGDVRLAREVLRTVAIIA